MARRWSPRWSSGRACSTSRRSIASSAAVGAAQERGIPLADALRSLAFDLREHDKRELIEVAGRKQISMLVPVVTLILPVAIVFAFYPGVVAIRTLAR